MRMLVTTQPVQRHWRPLAPIAVALRAAGHEVAFVATPTFRTLIENHGFRCFSAGLDDWIEPTPPSAKREVPAAAPEQAESIWVNLYREAITCVAR